jgi:heat shock protein HspQ
MKRKFEFGEVVQDKITKYEGVVVGYANYMTGCDQWLVQSTAIEGNKYPESHWIDEGKLALISRGDVTSEDVQAEDNGCDCKQPHH